MSNTMGKNVDEFLEKNTPKAEGHYGFAEVSKIIDELLDEQEKKNAKIKSYLFSKEQIEKLKIQ